MAEIKKTTKATEPKKTTKDVKEEVKEEVVDSVENEETGSSKYTKVDPNMKKPEGIPSDKALENLRNLKAPNMLLPGKTFEQVREISDEIDKLPDEEKDKFDNEFQDTVSVMNYGLTYLPSSSKDTYKDRINNKDSKFVNSLLNSDNKQVNIRTLKATDIDTSRASQGLLLKQFMSLMGKGETVNIPLWHSGFRIVVTPFTTAELVELDTKLTKEMIDVGRESMGLALSNDHFIYNKYFIDMLMEHIESTTLDINLQEDDLLKYISVLDLQLIYLSLITAIYTNGLDITTVCSETSKVIDGKPRCNFTVTGKIDPSKLLWVDISRLTKVMIKQVSTFSSKRITKENVKWYQEEILKYSNGLKSHALETITGGIETDYLFRIPTLRQYLDDGEIWFTEITTAINNSITKDKTNEERNNIVATVKSLQQLTSYIAYVDSIRIGEGSITDRETLLKALVNREPSGKANKDLINAIDAILKYIETSSVAIVALPSYTCPDCEKEQKLSITTRLKYFIPIELTTLFFDLNALYIATLTTAE